MRKSPFPPVSPTKSRRLKNEQVRSLLDQHGGDDGTSDRHVVHYLYPHSINAKPRWEVAANLVKLGFFVDIGRGDSGVVAEEIREVASVDFDSLTEAFEQMARDNGWVYDGWECEAIHKPQNEWSMRIPREALQIQSIDWK